MKKRTQLLLLGALLSLSASTSTATSWAYMAHYPWIYTLDEGWLYHPPVEKVFQNGEWVLNPLGDSFDIGPLFSAALTTFAGTDEDQFVFRLTVSSEFPNLGLLAIGDLPSVREEPIVNAIDESTRTALDPTGRADLPYPDNENRFDAYYIVRIKKIIDAVHGQTFLYFEAQAPFLSWAQRGPVHGMIRLNFQSLESGRFEVFGALDAIVGIDAFRGHFKAVVHEPPPPPPAVVPGE